MRLLGQFIYLFFFYKDILHKKNTQALIKYLNRPKEHNKAHKKLSFRYDAYKHKKTNNFSSKYFYTLKKAHKQLSFRYYA